MKIQVLFSITCVILLTPVSSKRTKPLDYYEKIYGGRVTFIERYPYQCALLLYMDPHCGGSILSQNFVLTAAHCTHIHQPSAFTIRAGSKNVYSGGVVVKVKRIIEHPRYKTETYDYDFALLELKKRLNFSQQIQPINIICQGQDILPGEEVYTLGWGKTEDNTISDVLRYTKIETINQKKCSEMYAKIDTPITKSGTNDGGKDACQGDSGGPLLIFLESACLVGVVSWGNGCANANYSGVYSKVSYVNKWIMKNVGHESCCDINDIDEKIEEKA